MALSSSPPGRASGRAGGRIASTSWQGAPFLTNLALQTMTASIVGGMLLMAAASSMYAIATALLRAGGVPP